MLGFRWSGRRSLPCRQWLSVVCLLTCMGSAWAQSTVDPFKSGNWNDLRKKYFGDAPLVFDDRVRVLAPQRAEDAMNVPVTVWVQGLPDVKRIVVIADYNPINKVLEFRPGEAEPSIGFRVKLQQGTPIRAVAQTADGVWRAGGTWVDASGGGCTAPSLGRSQGNWADHLNEVQARLWQLAEGERLRVKIMHPMDTGLAPGIPAFYIEKLALREESGREMFALELFEPVSENPVLSFDLRVQHSALRLVGRDNNGNLIDARIEQ